MHFNHVSYDGQPQAETAIPASRTTIGLPESVENVRQELRFDANARIVNGYLDLFSVADQSCFDAPFRVRELDCIGEKVPDYLLQPVSVTEDETAMIIDQDLQIDSFGFGARPDDINGR